MAQPLVLIAGCGIGGLATAFTLHQIGVPCLVFESVREIKPLGVGVNLQQPLPLAAVVSAIERQVRNTQARGGAVLSARLSRSRQAAAAGVVRLAHEPVP